jgi:hypothetical protein
MPYTTTLPGAFPVYADIPVIDARSIANFLIRPASDEAFPHGSSFAITTDCIHPDVYRRLWLSQASADRLAKSGFYIGATISTRNPDEAT